MFALSGRGTAVVGYIEEGEVTTGDRVVVEGSSAASRVASVEGVRDADWTPKKPAPVGLLVPELTTEDIAPGDYLVSG